MLKIKPIENQSLFDFALQTTGFVESIFEMAKANNLSITDDLLLGSEIIILNEFPKNLDILKYYQSNSVIPATGNVADLLPTPAECTDAEFTDEFNYEYNTCLNPEDDGFFDNDFSNEFLT